MERVYDGDWKLNNLDDFPKHDLTPRERQEIRRIIEGDRGWRWLRTGMRRTGLWVLAVIGAIVLLRDTIRSILEGIFS